MEKLLSKIQYKSFEPGEFIEEQLRTQTELFTAIEAIPWEKEREHLHVDLTTTSITIQSDTPTYLKLALYYNGKFILYFFDGNQLFSKSIASLNEARPIISGYFDTLSVNLAQFKKESLLFRHIAVHFPSKVFVYMVNGKRINSFLIKTSAINFCLSIFMLVVVAFSLTKPATDVWVIGVVYFIVFFVAGGGINLLVFYNYYRYMKNKRLIISKGNDVFLFGDTDSLKQYNKGNIKSVIIQQPGNGKNPLSDFAIFEIRFLDNTGPIVFTSLLIDTSDFKTKFDERIISVENNSIPLMRPA